jgi:hypothetical protein
MSRNARARLRRGTIGYVFQDFNLLPGRQRVAIARAMVGERVTDQIARAPGPESLLAPGDTR